jgi:hypothetical protein
MNFFDFARSIKLEKKINAPRNTTETRPDVFVRHELLQQHKLADSHQLVQYWNEELGHTDAEYVPRVVRVSHGYGNTRGVSKTGNTGTGTVLDFGTPRHTAYPYRGVTGIHGLIM